MCGILGSVNISFSKDILDLLRHRGPDDWGIEELNIDGDLVCFGHRRLSILDLSKNGHQPMYSHDGRFLIVFNGEIYNHLELRKKMQNNIFRGHSDTESIVNYMSIYGPESFIDFNGIFAFGLLDMNIKKIYIARDKFGVKPIYYWHNREEKKFIFASEIKPILHILKNLNKSSIEINKEALITYLTLRYNPSRNTLIKGIYKLYPGDLLEYDLESGTLKKIININEKEIPQIKIDREKSEDFWIDLLADILEDSIKRQMLSDVEVGVFLSGGLDSALITAIASRYTRGKLKTFCIGFEGAKDYSEDEREDARTTAKILDTEHFETVAEPKNYLDFIRKTIWFLEEPNGTAPTFAQYEVARLASRYVKVALSGQGADEIFMGYRRYFFADKLNSLLKIKKIIPINFLKFQKLKRITYALRGSDLYDIFIKAFSVFEEKELKQILKFQLNKINVNDLKYFYSLINKENKTFSEIMSILDTYTWLSDELLMYGDKMTMAFSLEMRVPFLDNEVVKVASKIPSRYKIRKRQHKYILKKVALKFLPEEIVYRKKRGFSLPILSWLKSELQEPLRRMFVENPHPIHEFIKKTYIEQLLDMYLHGKETDTRKAILLIHFGIFLEEFFNKE